MPRSIPIDRTSLANFRFASFNKKIILIPRDSFSQRVTVTMIYEKENPPSRIRAPSSAGWQQFLESGNAESSHDDIGRWYSRVTGTKRRWRKKDEKGGKKLREGEREREEKGWKQGRQGNEKGQRWNEASGEKKERPQRRLNRWYFQT